jgi:hypothetical protein
MAISLFIYLLSIVCWLGGMVFFTIITAQSIFAVLGAADAGKVVSAIFPRYYLLGYVAGTISLILAIYFLIRLEPRFWWAMAAIALAIALGLTVYAGGSIRPRIDAIKATAIDLSADTAHAAEFKQLHRLSVALNGGTMLLNLFALLSTAIALAPRV